MRTADSTYGQAPFLQEIFCALRISLVDQRINARQLRLKPFYLLLLIRAEAVNSESRMGLPTIQRVLGRSFSREDCQQALAMLAAHDLLTWAPVFPRPSWRRRAQWAREDLEIVFSIRNVCEGRRL